MNSRFENIAKGERRLREAAAELIMHGAVTLQDRPTDRPETSGKSL